MIVHQLLSYEESKAAKVLIIQNKGFPFCSPENELEVGLLRALFRYEDDSVWVGAFDENTLIGTTVSALNAIDGYGFFSYGTSLLPEYDTHENRVQLVNAMKLIPNVDRTAVTWMGAHDESLIDAIAEGLLNVQSSPASNPLLVKVSAVVPPCPQ
jgi:hypothetical protein